MVVPASGEGPPPDKRRPTCDGSGKLLKAKGRFNLRYTLSCNYMVQGLTLKANRRITKVMAKPKLVPSESSELTCERGVRPRRARCSGDVRENVTIKGSLRVKPDPCGKPQLRINAEARGGPDCGDNPCPAIAYNSKTEFVPAGC
jgi:hypothetical protein